MFDVIHEGCVSSMELGVRDVIGIEVRKIMREMCDVAEVGHGKWRFYFQFGQ